MAGPTSHPIKPASYMEINNFYTSTVYEKGAEIIRMIRTMLGVDGFRKGMDKYFELYDGQAVRTEDFIHAMSVANGNYDFGQFERWYAQAGTPIVKADWTYDSDAKTFALTLSQTCPSTPGQDTKDPFYFPFGVGLLDSEGRDMPLNLAETKGQPQLDQGVLHLKEKEQTFVFNDISETPVVSLNRGFTAPIQLEASYSAQELAFLLGHDSDEFSRFEAGQILAGGLLDELIAKTKKGEELALDPLFAEAWGKVLADSKIDNAFKAPCLGLPAETRLHQGQKPILIDETHSARNFMRRELASKYEAELTTVYQSLNDNRAYSFNADDMGARELKNTCLSYLGTLENPATNALVWKQYQEANNMTDRYSALLILVNIHSEHRQEALDDFHKRFHTNQQVLQKWFATQASSVHPDTFDHVQKLLDAPDYDKSVPNLFRSLVGIFSRNHLHFHRKDGRGYSFVADKVLEMDGINPQMASSLAGSFKHLKKMPEANRALMEKELQRIKGTDGLSKNVYEIVSKTLA